MAFKPSIYSPKMDFGGLLDKAQWFNPSSCSRSAFALVISPASQAEHDNAFVITFIRTDHTMHPYLFREDLPANLIKH